MTATARATRPKPPGERQLEHWLTKWLHDFDQKIPGRLEAYHTNRSDRSPAGFPDWMFASPYGVMFRENKGPTEKLKPDQQRWADMLLLSGQDFDIWRPADYLSGRIQIELQELAFGLGVWRRNG